MPLTGEEGDYKVWPSVKFNRSWDTNEITGVSVAYLHYLIATIH